MKKILLATTTVIMLFAASAPSFSEQSEEGMKLREMRRAELFMMKKMVDANMVYMKSQEEMMTHFVEMLQKMIECEDKNLRDGQGGC